MVKKAKGRSLINDLLSRSGWWFFGGENGSADIKL